MNLSIDEVMLNLLQTGILDKIIINHNGHDYHIVRVVVNANSVTPESS